MPILDFETSVTDFLALGRRLQAEPTRTGQQALDELTAWYRDSRITGTEVDYGNDTLLLQWGAQRQLIFSEPTDLRTLNHDAIRFTDQKVKYLDFTRQVFAPGDDTEAEFDDLAVHMSVTLGYDAADGSEPSSNQWISTPDEIESGSKEFTEVPFVQSLLPRPAKSIIVTVDHCG